MTDDPKDHTHVLLQDSLNVDASRELQLAYNNAVGDLCKKYKIKSDDLIPFAQINLLMLLRVYAIALARCGVDFEKTRLVYINSILRMPDPDEDETKGKLND